MAHLSNRELWRVRLLSANLPRGQKFCCVTFAFTGTLEGGQGCRNQRIADKTQYIKIYTKLNAHDMRTYERDTRLGTQNQKKTKFGAAAITKEI